MSKAAQAPVATVTSVWRTIKTAHLSNTSTVNETPSLSTQAAGGREQTRIFTSVSALTEERGKCLRSQGWTSPALCLL